MKRNIAMLLEYDGSRYNGWQKQGNTENTIQAKLEGVLEKMTGSRQEVAGSGRTDAGVHAVGQVANVHLDTDLSPGQIRDYLNRYLPEDILVLEVKDVPAQFHSRLLAREKTYIYRLETGIKGCVFQRKYTCVPWEKLSGGKDWNKELDLDAMKKTAAYLLGAHDFAGFSTGRNKKKSTVRTIKSLDILKKGSLLEIHVTGDGFLYNMVRILTGTLIEAGMGQREPESVKEILKTGNRQLAGFTAPAKGLFLARVVYDEEIFNTSGDMGRLGKRAGE